MSSIGSNEQTVLLEHLYATGASTERELEVALGDVDQIGPDDIAEWATDAAEVGLVEQTAGSTAVRRWRITDAGRRAIGNNPDRS